MPIETWRLLDLGALDPLDTQIIYHMVAHAISEGEADNTLIICWPAEPIVSLGYFQEPEKDIELEFCQENDIVVTRRVLGGGGVYLDDGQLFYQLISHKDSKVTPKGLNAYYRKLLEAPVQVYRDLGIDAEFRPVNDIQAEGKKISGNGAGDIEDARILTGNLILDFNFAMMVRVLKVPSEKFRDKIAQSLRERMSTILKLTGKMPDKEILKKDLVARFQESLDIKLVTGELSDWERKKMSEMRQKYLSDEWLYWRSGRRIPDGKTVRISATTTLGTANYKAPGGLVRVTVEVEDEKVKDIIISGDFSMFPSEAIFSLEKALHGSSIDEEAILERIENIYKEDDIDSPGVTPEDITTAIKQALKAH